MKAFRFHAVIGEDRIIRVPQGIDLLLHEAEVILLQREEPVKSGESQAKESVSSWPLVQRLAKAAEEVGGDDLPPDLAENHDHYLYGCPKSDD